MTLIYEFDLDSLKMYWRTKNEVSVSQGFQKLERKQDRHTETDRRDRTHYQPH